MTESTQSIPFVPAAVPRASAKGAAAERKQAVLATLCIGEETYRVFADLVVTAGSAYLRLHRFDLPQGDDWLAERKINIPVAEPDTVPLETKLGQAEYMLSSPIWLDEATARVFFGRWGPPAT